MTNNPEPVTFEFDRYVNGVLMAEGVTIEREETLEAAMLVAARIASRGSNGEAPVLVLRPNPEPVAQADLVKLKSDAGLPDMPTPLTYELRQAVSGEGPRAYDWQDKPHRLLYDACREVERLRAEIARKDEALQRYGWHEEGCPMHTSSVTRNTFCACGLDAALKEPNQ